MSTGYVIYHCTPLWKLKVCIVVIHIGVGYLGVARTGELGNAKALSSGTSNRYRFPRFFFLYGLILVYYLNRPVLGSLLERMIVINGDFL